MNFMFPWLLWQRFLEKKRAKNAKILKELREAYEHPALIELAERDPKLKEALRSLGVKTGDAKPRDDE